MFVSVPSVFLVAIAKQVPRVRVYGSTSVAKKNHFTSKKPTHTYNTQCVPRPKVNHRHLLSQGIFIQQPIEITPTNSKSTPNSFTNDVSLPSPP